MNRIFIECNPNKKLRNEQCRLCWATVNYRNLLWMLPPLPTVTADRYDILYGNAATNAAWKTLLGNCSIQVTKGRVQAGDKMYTGNDLGAYFVAPRR